VVHTSEVDKAVRDPVGQGGSHMYRLLTSVLGSFELLSLLLTEDSILDSCYEIWDNCANYYKEACMEL
jgi:hypothetical protein